MNYEGKHVLVLGLGESGLAMAQWLHRCGARVRVADTREQPARLAGLRDAGVLRAIFGLPSAGRDQVLPLLDKYAALATRIG